MRHSRLERAVKTIAQHAEYAGKDQLVQSCMHELEDRYCNGQLDLREKSRLLGMLLGDHSDTVVMTRPRIA